MKIAQGVARIPRMPWCHCKYQPVSWLPRIGQVALNGLGLLAILSLTGCVTPIPVKDQAATASYIPVSPVVIAVIDERPELQQGKKTNYIGRAHITFGIPADIFVYPFLTEDKAYKEQSLAAALEERLVLGLNEHGWAASPAGFEFRRPTEDIVSLLGKNGSRRFLQLAIKSWEVSLNLNWVSAFNFDWGIEVEVIDESGQSIARYQDAGRDVVDEEADQSPANHVRLAFRERLIKILDDERLRLAMQSP